jgi:hypothetical protein
MMMFDVDFNPPHTHDWSRPAVIGNLAGVSDQTCWSCQAAVYKTYVSIVSLFLQCHLCSKAFSPSLPNSDH